MFERIRQHVDAYLASRGEPGMQAGKVIFLDDTEGLVAGSVQLIFGESSDYPLLIAKGAPQDRMRLRGGRSLYEVEYENLKALEAAGMNEGGPTTPQPLGLWREDGLIVALQAGLPGTLLKNIPGFELFSEEAIGRSLEDILAWWERLQDSFGVKRQALDDETYRRRILEPLDAFQRRFAVASDERAFLDRRLRDERSLAGIDLPLFVRHGDLCTANMARMAEGIGVFDWEFALVPELPLFDVFHFFASLRYPFRGARGEASHFDSFVEVYWGNNYVNHEVRQRLASLCEKHAIPRDALGDLFLISLIQIANLKYEGFVEIYGSSRLDPSYDRPATEGEIPWRPLGGRDKNAPFACIKDGAYENTRYIARNGLPRF